MVQVTDLERTTDALVEMESRAETAENERDAALTRLRISTPRPQPNLGSMPSFLDAAGLKKFQQALSNYKCAMSPIMHMRWFSEASFIGSRTAAGSAGHDQCGGNQRYAS